MGESATLSYSSTAMVKPVSRLVIQLVKPLFVTALLLAASAAHADPTSLRCLGKITKLGDTKSEVRQVCGRPLSREDVGQVERRVGNQIRTVFLEEWIMKVASERYLLTFEGSTLVDIEWLHQGRF